MRFINGVYQPWDRGYKDVLWEYIQHGNQYGKLGDGTTTDHSTPAPVQTGDRPDLTAKQVMAGYSKSCVIASDDQAYCWGTNTGNSTSTISNLPVAVDLGDRPDLTVKQIAIGFTATCVIASNDQAYCWGTNTGGRLGDGTTTARYTPVAILKGNRPDLIVKQVAVGATHICAISSNDQVYCWGENGAGQLGDGTTTNRSTPVAVQLGDRPNLYVKAISSGGRHTCTIASNDQIYCWGLNGNGQLGDNTYAQRNTPVAVLLGDRPNLTVKHISTGGSHNCAISSNDRAYCWGNNGSGLGGGCNVPECRTPVAIDSSNLPPTTYIVTMDAGSAPAPCIDVVIASDELSLTCTTTAHVAGWVDVTIDDGVNTVVLADGYEYVENFGEGGEEEEGEEGGGGIIDLIEELLSPDSGTGGIVGWIVLGEVAFVVIGVGVFFRLRES